MGPRFQSMCPQRATTGLRHGVAVIRYRTRLFRDGGQQWQQPLNRIRLRASRGTSGNRCPASWRSPVAQDRFPTSPRCAAVRNGVRSFLGAITPSTPRVESPKNARKSCGCSTRPARCRQKCDFWISGRLRSYSTSIVRLATGYRTHSTAHRPRSTTCGGTILNPFSDTWYAKNLNERWLSVTVEECLPPSSAIADARPTRRT